jgi:hypothetical protein
VLKLFTRLPESVRASRTLQWLILFGGPAAVSGAMWLVNLVNGTAFAPGCGIGGVLLAAADQTGLLAAADRVLPLVDVLRPPASSCHSVPFSADLANMVLSVTAGLALSVYLLFDLRLGRLRDELVGSGLIVSPSGSRTCCSS